jgi:hypothetical protein
MEAVEAVEVPVLLQLELEGMVQMALEMELGAVEVAQP